MSCQPHLGPYAVITAAAGHNMEEIYKEASKNNMTIVGGADPNVGVGGYITGGGHSPLGSSYGMAVDNVLEMTVVTPKGDIVVANECLNYNLYWAMRGVRFIPLRLNHYKEPDLPCLGRWSNFRRAHKCHHTDLSHSIKLICDVRFQLK